MNIDANLISVLQADWQRLITASAVNNEDRAEQLFNELLTAYSESQRHYHTLEHIADMLAHLKMAGIHDVAGLWATWFHDFVYQPGSKRNESLSAQRAQDAMTALGVATALIDKACAIILATQHHQVESDADSTLVSVLDADMAILGVPEQAYQRYCQAIQREFSAVPAFLYRRGRRKFLKAVLAEQKIFHSAYFFEKFEAQARLNLRTELAILS